MKVKNLKSKKHLKKGVKSKDILLVEASIKQLSLIGALIDKSVLSSKEKENIDLLIKGFISEGKAEELISYLYENQRCDIDSGYNYGQKDIINKLKKFI